MKILSKTHGFELEELEQRFGFSDERIIYGGAFTAETLGIAGVDKMLASSGLKDPRFESLYEMPDGNIGIIFQSEDERGYLFAVTDTEEEAAAVRRWREELDRLTKGDPGEYFQRLCSVRDPQHPEWGELPKHAQMRAQLVIQAGRYSKRARRFAVVANLDKAIAAYPGDFASDEAIAVWLERAQEALDELMLM